MPVTYVGRSASVANGAGAITPALPSGLQVDDVLLLPLETSAAEAITISNQNGGTWAEVANSPQSIAGVRLTAFWSRYNGTQGNPTTSDSGDHNTGVILAFRGCITTGDPWDITVPSTQASTTAGSIDGGVTTVDGCMICAIAATDRDLASTTNADAWTNASLTNLAERVDQIFSGANGGGLAIATGEKAVAGTVDATTWTQAGAAALANLMIALRPPEDYTNLLVVELEDAIDPGTDEFHFLRARVRAG